MNEYDPRDGYRSDCLGNCLGKVVIMLAVFVPVSLVIAYDGTWRGIAFGLLTGLLLEGFSGLMEGVATAGDEYPTDESGWALPVDEPHTPDER